VLEVVRHNRLHCFGHVERKSDDDWIMKCQQLMVEGKAGRGRGRKTRMECVRRDMRELRMSVDDGQAWNGNIFG